MDPATKINMKTKNSAFVDSQNLYLGTKAAGWLVDHKKFCIYLRENYSCDEIYLFIGSVRDEHAQMYIELQKAGYILIFREHGHTAVSLKKGNVDADLMFELMRQYAEEEPTRNFILVSGDGDYFKAVRHLVGKGRLIKVLLPNSKFASSLYKKLGSEYYDFMYNIKSYIQYHKKEKGS